MQIILYLNFQMLSVFEPLLKVFRFERIKTDDFFFRIHYKVMFQLFTSLFANN